MYSAKPTYSEYLIDFKKVINTLVDKYPFYTYRGAKRSMRNIDLSLVYYLIREYKPDAFFESGIWRGRCTFIVAESLKQLGLDIPYYIACSSKYRNTEEIKTVVKDYPNIVPHYEVGQTAAKQVSNHNRLGVLIDGPKWRDETKMLRLYGRLMRNNTILFAVHHDIDSGHVLDRPYFNKFYKANKSEFAKWYPNTNISAEDRIFIDDKEEAIFSAVLLNRGLI